MPVATFESEATRVALEDAHSMDLASPAEIFEVIQVHPP